MTWLGIAIVIAGIFIDDGLTNVAKAIAYLADKIKEDKRN
jgi:hypothetical protein